MGGPLSKNGIEHIDWLKKQTYPAGLLISQAKLICIDLKVDLIIGSQLLSQKTCFCIKQHITLGLAFP